MGHPESPPSRPEPPPERPSAAWRRALPSTARTRIIGWVLLLVMAALGVVTLVTWWLLNSAINARMDEALQVEVQEFGELSSPGVNPRTGEPFTSVDEVIREAIAYNIARPNEKFLGYVDGEYRAQSRQEPGATQILADDPEFAERVATVSAPARGLYPHPEVGEVRYLAIPVRLAGDPAHGVIVAAYLGDAERADASRAARLMLIVGSVTVLGAAGAAWLIAGRILRPVRDVTETARTITDTDLSMRIPTRSGSRDELNDLADTVNDMLDRIESGVAAQRRFIDDAGHELRTPITIVRGHLDVLDPTDPDDVSTTLALVDDELTRMNRMVSDLLLLARSEQPSFLQPELVDVDALTQEAFDKVSALAERDFVLETSAQVTLMLDSQRITQALVALSDNACRFTEPGGRIALGSQLSGGWLRFWVTDSGPGVSPEERNRIFERFARGSQGRHDADGAGLGLSIVRAIAVAHGGDVLLDSPPGRGATFTVIIPAVFPPTLEQPWPTS